MVSLSLPWQQYNVESALIFRGSRNQRIIDVPASLEKGEAVVLDWDNP